MCSNVYSNQNSQGQGQGQSKGEKHILDDISAKKTDRAKMLLSVESLTQMQNIIYFVRSSRTNRGGTASSQKMVKFLSVGNKIYFKKKN